MSNDAFEYLRPTVVDIDLDALVRNLAVLRQRVGGAEVMAILKANAYGHGLIPCARALEKAGVNLIGVAFLEEGVMLRRAGIRIPILALGGISGRQLDGFLDNQIDLTASSVYKLERIEAAAKAKGVIARVHLKIDTGMERIGAHYYTAEELLAKSLSCPNCNIVSVFSHFASSEGEDLAFARMQLERFFECLRFYEKRSVPTPKRHIANSGGILQLPESYLDIVRPGLVLFGVAPNPRLAGILATEPVLSLRSEISFFKVVKKGATVSYERTWEAPEDTRVVTIPIGYGDGYSRGLSNRGSALVRGIRCPIVGKVCMDQLMLNLGPNGVGYNGDEVVLIGRQGDDTISVEEIAGLLSTDPREVLCSLNARVPRRFSYEGTVFLE